MNKVTGKLFLRGTRKIVDGKQVMMVIGTIGVSPDTDLAEGESFYAVDLSYVTWIKMKESLKTEPMRADQILYSPVWQV